MAEKGARHQLEGLARQMYVDGKPLTEIADTLNVSRQTLTGWKGRTRRGDQETDEWDQARERKGDHYQRMQALFDRQMAWVEETLPHLVTPAMVDALSKLGALVEKTEKIVAAARKQALAEAADSAATTAQKAGVSEETILKIRRDVLGMTG